MEHLLQHPRLGALIDAEMIWLWAVIVMLGGASSWVSGVRLTPTRASRRWHGTLLGTSRGAVLANIAVQLVVRAQDWLAPNTFGQPQPQPRP